MHRLHRRDPMRMVNEGNWTIGPMDYRGPHALEWTAPCALSALGFPVERTRQSEIEPGVGIYRYIYT